MTGFAAPPPFSPGAPTFNSSGQLMTGVTAEALSAAFAGVPAAISTIADLRAFAAETVGQPQCYVLGYAAAGDGGQGFFVYNPADTTSADNGGTIIVDAAERRWYRNIGASAVSMPWFGTTDATALQSSVTALLASPGGGNIVSPIGHEAVATSLPSNYAGVALDFLGPNVPVSLGGETGGSSYISQKATLFQDAGNHVGIGHIGHSFVMNPVGSGNIGPTNADYAVGISNVKQNAQATTVAGELDGLTIFVRNGGANSDSAGILVNTANYGTGTNFVMEGVCSAIVDGAVTHEVDVQVAVVDTRTNAQFGVVSQLFTGNGTCAYLAQSDAGCVWTNFINCTDDAGTSVFSVSGNGFITATSLALTGGLAAVSMAVEYENDTGIFLLQAGTVDASSIGILINAPTPTVGAFAAFQAAGATIGSISTSTGTTTLYGTTSDRRLKNIHGASDGSVIDSIKVYQAAFKSTPTVVHSMLIADELQKSIPHAVKGEADAVDDKGKIVPQMVDHSWVVPDLVAYCQGLKAQLAELTAEVSALKGAKAAG
jgi:hypothetical protein